MTEQTFTKISKGDDMKYIIYICTALSVLFLSACSASVSLDNQSSYDLKVHAKRYGDMASNATFVLAQGETKELSEFGVTSTSWGRSVPTISVAWHSTDGDGGDCYGTVIVEPRPSSPTLEIYDGENMYDYSYKR